MPILLIALLLAGGVALIAGLCWVWMQSTRASQARQDRHNERVAGLLEEQNELLRRLAGKQ